MSYKKRWFAGVENHNLKDHQNESQTQKIVHNIHGLEALKEQKTTQQIAAEYDIHPTQVSSAVASAIRSPFIFNSKDLLRKEAPLFPHPPLTQKRLRRIDLGFW